jgi:fucose permease
MKRDNLALKILPVMLAFFTMGFVDMVGIAVNYVKLDFSLSDTAANFYTVMVFLWFLVFSVPTGLLMNKIGRKKTVLLSLIITFVGLCVPFVYYSNVSMFVTFFFLGVGNTLLQVSLNPLLTNLVSAKKIPSYLTMGQFVKAIASFIAPVIATQAVLRFGDWKLLFPIFAVISLLTLFSLLFTKIKELPIEGKPSTYGECFKLLGNSLILFLFLGILVHVGLDVGINISAPKLMQERAGMTLADAGFATSWYFIFRTFGCFAGTFILSKISAHKFYIVSVLAILAGVLGLFFSYNATLVYICLALMGLGNANVFPIIFSKALMYMPDRNNEISGLMIMGVSGGAVFPVFMGMASDALGGQIGAVIILIICVSYLTFLFTKLKKIHPKQD